MEQEVEISGLTRPLFGFFRLPGANIIDPTSPLGMSAFANALAELEALDKALSRKDSEVEDSKHITFVSQTAVQYADNRGIQLPRFVKSLGASGGNITGAPFVQEHVPTMLTDARIKDINFNLSMAGVKCGFSEGVFVMDGQTGMMTATQVESDDRDTIQTIKADRDALRCAVEQAIEGANALASLYKVTGEGEYEASFNWGDITYNYAEDKESWRNYASQGWIPVWLYLTKFEGMSEEEAKKIVAEASAAEKEKGLFDEE